MKGRRQVCTTATTTTMTKRKKPECHNSCNSQVIYAPVEVPTIHNVLSYVINEPSSFFAGCSNDKVNIEFSKKENM